MGENKANNITLLTDLIASQDVLLECCTEIRYRNGEEPLLTSAPRTDEPGFEKAYALKFIPEYLVPVYRERSGYVLKSYPGMTGYAISVKDFADIESYMQVQMDKKVRGNMLRSVRRFETCFEVTYKRFYGEISEAEFEALTGQLRQMIGIRFRERNQKSDTLREWEKIIATLYGQIFKKQASIFVIYERDIPVSISVSYHYNGLFFYYITSYDTDYSKFSMGNIMLYKQLEWCFEHDISWFDMGWGDLDYKRRWSNYIFRYRHEHYFPAKSIKSWFKLYKDEAKDRIMYFLLSRNVNVYYRKFRNRISFSGRHPVDSPKLEAQPIVRGIHPEAAGLPPLPEGEYALLKPAIYDFLYASQEAVQDIAIHKCMDGGYLIQGRNAYQKLESVNGNT